MVLWTDQVTKTEVQQVLDEKGKEMLKEIGGVPCWKTLPEDECLRLGRKLICDSKICLGERVLEQLPAAERQGCWTSIIGLDVECTKISMR